MALPRWPIFLCCRSFDFSLYFHVMAEWVSCSDMFFLFFSFYCYVFVYFHASVTAMSYLSFLSISMRYLFFHVPFVCVYIYIYLSN